MKNIFTIINLLILALVAYAIFSFVNNFTNFKKQSEKVHIKKKKTKKTVIKEIKKKELSSYRNIEKRNIFNTMEKPPAPPKPVKIAKPVPRVNVRRENLIKKSAKIKANLKLLGTIMLPNKNSCIIRDNKKRKEGLYQIGDMINEVVVEKIGRGKVTLNLNGELFEIRSTSAVDLHKFMKNREISNEKFDEEKLLSSKKLKAIDKDIKNLLRQINIRSYVENGKIKGFVINNINPNSFFAKMGFKRGDVIKEVNGKTLTSFDDLKKHYEEIKKDATQFGLTIKRQGKIRKIRYIIK